MALTTLVDGVGGGCGHGGGRRLSRLVAVGGGGHYGDYGGFGGGFGGVFGGGFGGGGGTKTNTTCLSES